MKKKKNLKTRYLLALGMVTLTAVGALSASTFAWFVANRTATGSVSNVAAQAVGNLQVAVGESTTFDSTFTFEQTTPLTDISGNGLSFFKPIFQVGSDSNFSAVNSITSSSGYYQEFKLTFRSTEAMQLYIGNGTTVSLTGGTNSTDLYKAVRVAFLNDTATSVTNVFTESEDDIHFLNGTTATTTDVTGAGYSDTYGTDVKVLRTGVVNRVLNSDSNATDNKSNALVNMNTLVGTYYQATITVRYWLEGVDSSCLVSELINADGTYNTLQMALSFYGLVPDTIGA